MNSPTSNNNISNEITCSICQKQFSRQEHLKRHSLIHENNERHQCDLCPKSFLRKDALSRHKTVHAQSGSVLHAKGRACFNCATAKSRCSGSLPCSRCSSKGVNCSYPAGSRRRAGSTNSTTDQEQQQHDNSHSLNTTTDVYSSADISLQPSSQLEMSAVTPNIEQPSLHHEFPDISQNNTYAGFQVEASTYMGGTTFMVPIDNHSNSGTHFDQSYWNPGVLSDINWLPINDGFSYEPMISPVGHSNLDFLIGSHTSPQLESHLSFAPPSTDLMVASGQIENHDIIQSPKTNASRESAEFYVDGDAGRLPRVKRRKVMSRPTPSSQVHIESHFSLALSHHPQRNQISWITHIQYDIMKEMYNRLCIDHSPYFQSFEQQEFPSQATFDSLIDLYFDHFDQSLPFLPCDPSILRDRDWRVLLGLAALGSAFLKNDNSQLFAASMNEFLARVMLFDERNKDEMLPENVSLVQIRLLYVISLLYGSSKDHESTGISELSKICRICRKLWQTTSKLLGKEHVSDQHERANTDWKYDEEKRRTGFCIWLLDCMCAFQFQSTPFLRLEDAANIELPCMDDEWRSAKDSRSTPRPGTRSTPTLLEAIQNLYIEKRLLPGLGEFSRIILIYSLFQRTWEVEHYIRQGLSRFEPIAEKRSSADLQPQLPIWPPAIPLFNRWRNSACDCLDILHWSANAMIGAASGMEHPTVLHLHLARVVLLSPLDSITRFALHLGNMRNDTARMHPVGSEQVLHDKSLIQRWVVQDQYKSRLAAIHAGVLFWHVRKYSTNAFHEPFAVASATLMLWALTTFSTKYQTQTNQQLPEATENEHDPSSEIETRTAMDDGVSSSSDICDIILLDRPTDDELVQQFVKHGRTMRANMTGVGDLWGPNGGNKVLLEGHKLLGSLSAWGYTTSYWLRILEKLLPSAIRGSK